MDKSYDLTVNFEDSAEVIEIFKRILNSRKSIGIEYRVNDFVKCDSFKTDELFLNMSTNGNSWFCNDSFVRDKPSSAFLSRIDHYNDITKILNVYPDVKKHEQQC